MNAIRMEPRIAPPDTDPLDYMARFMRLDRRVAEVERKIAALDDMAALYSDRSWRPIESAPTAPGSRALLYWSPWVIDGWLAEGGHWFSERFNGRLAPTHWMPLPHPPEEPKP